MQGDRTSETKPCFLSQRDTDTTIIDGPTFTNEPRSCQSAVIRVRIVITISTAMLKGRTRHGKERYVGYKWRRSDASPELLVCILHVRSLKGQRSIARCQQPCLASTCVAGSRDPAIVG
jgi:hypothetical protein